MVGDSLECIVNTYLEILGYSGMVMKSSYSSPTSRKKTMWTMNRRPQESGLPDFGKILNSLIRTKKSFLKTLLAPIKQIKNSLLSTKMRVLAPVLGLKRRKLKWIHSLIGQKINFLDGFNGNVQQRHQRMKKSRKGMWQGWKYENSIINVPYLNE